MEALADACARNIPVEVFRATDRCSAPGRGRLLILRDDELVIEKLQMIGTKFELSLGTAVEGYFRYGSELYRFDSKVKETMVAVRLNGRLVVPALRLAPPTKVIPGQRRGAFRVNLASRTDAPAVRLWLQPELATVDEGAEVPELPVNAPSFSGRLVNASETGLGLLLEACTYSRLKLLQEATIAVDLVDEEDPLIFRVTVRHAASVREVDARVGVHLLDDGSRGFARKIRRLARYVSQVQREQLR